MKEIKKVLNVDHNKFDLICVKKNYEFLVENKEIKDKWIEVINHEIKRINKIEKKNYNDILHLDLKKKVIDDYFGFHLIEDNIEYIRDIVNSSMKNEKFFKSKSDM